MHYVPADYWPKTMVYFENAQKGSGDWFDKFLDYDEHWVRKQPEILLAKKAKAKAKKTGKGSKGLVVVHLDDETLE